MKSLDYYRERMAYFPSYGAPTKIDEDEEFVYYRFSVPRHFIRFMMEEGSKWPQYEETEEEGTLEESAVLGVRHLPVCMGIAIEGTDADFVHYKCPVPKRVLEEPVPFQDFTYEYMYTTKEKWEIACTEVEDDFEFEIPAAGTSMPDRQDLEAVRTAKTETVYFYEVTFSCEECGEVLEPFIATDLFDAMYEKDCPYCTGTKLKIVSSKAILKEDDNE